MNRLRGYSSPFNLGHRALEDFWSGGTVYATEKIDGSQFSFGLIEGELVCRSRKVQIDLDDPGMFALGVSTVEDLEAKGLLQEGWTYRGEFLSKPKHNTMAYERVPRGNIILFDVDRGDQDYVMPKDLWPGADKLGLGAVPLLMTYGSKPTLENVKVLLKTESVLGGGLVEGVVLKNYDIYGPDKKVLMAKLVSEVFRETHRKDWSGRNPSNKEFVLELSEDYANPVRWMKAVQHLREQDEIEGVPQDIPILMKEVIRDVEEECGDEIRDKLFHHFWNKTIRRQLTKGLPEFYKKALMEESFGLQEMDE